MGIQKFLYSTLEALVYLFPVPSGKGVIPGRIIAQGVAYWKNWTISTASCNSQFLGTALKRLSKGQNGGEMQICFPIIVYGEGSRY